MTSIYPVAMNSLGEMICPGPMVSVERVTVLRRAP